MIRRLALLLCAVALVGSPAGSARGAPDPPAETVLRLVRRLGDHEFSNREAAFQALLQMGLRAPDEVLAVLPKEDPDQETQARCDLLRKRIPWEAAQAWALKRWEGDPDMQERIRRLFDIDLNRFSTEEVVSPDAVVEDTGGTVSACGPLLFDFLKAASSRKPDAIEVLTRLMKSDNPDMRKTALVWLGQLGGGAKVELIAIYLADSDPGTRRIAVNALYTLRAASFSPRIAPLLRDPDPDVRNTALSFLGQFPHTPAAPVVADLLEDPACLRAALGALGAIRDPSYGPKIEKFLSYGDPWLRGAAMCGLAALGDPSYGPRIAAFLDSTQEEDPNAILRQSALGALGILGDKTHAPRVAKFLDGDGYSVFHITAISVLGRLKDKTFGPRLVEFVKNGARTSGFGDNAFCAMAALVELGDRSNAPVIAEVLTGGGRPHDRQDAAMALWKLLDRPWPMDDCLWPGEDPEARVKAARAWWEAHKDDPGFQKAK